jgi:hypothetical protein
VGITAGSRREMPGNKGLLQKANDNKIYFNSVGVYLRFE